MTCTTGHRRMVRSEMTNSQQRRWWTAAVAIAVGSLDVVAAFAGSSIALPFKGGCVSVQVRADSTLVLAGSSCSTRREALRSVGSFGVGMMCANSEGDMKKWGVASNSERDQAMGFLSAEADVAESEDVVARRRARAQLLARQAREALDAAREAEKHARNVKAKLTGQMKTQGAETPKFSNGLSSMLNPVAIQMAADQGEYLRRCPIRQMQEDLTEIRCGIMNIVGNLGPQNLLALGVVLYAISVIQISN